MAELARAAVQDGKGSAVMALDIKNAFNTVKWTKILETLAKLQALKYITRIIVEFLLGRRVYSDSDERLKLFPITWGTS